MNGLKKKVGPLPIWAWVLVAGTLGYIAYRYSKSSETGGVEEGLFPTQGIPEEREEAPASGLSSLGEMIDQITAAGFVPAGSEEAKSEGEPPANPWREWYEEGGDPRKAPAAAKAAAKKAGHKAKGGGKGKGAGKPKRPNKHGPKRGQEIRAPKTAAAEKHIHTPSHGPARSPRARMKVAAAHPAGGGQPKGGGGGGKKRRR